MTSLCYNIRTYTYIAKEAVPLKYWAGYVTAAVLGAIAWAMGQLADRYSTLVDMVYPYVTRTIQDVLAQWSSGVDFCVWQVVLMLLIIGAVAGLVMVIVMHWNPVRLLGWVLAGVSLLYLGNTLVYGLNYYSGSIADDIRMDVYEYTVDELKDAAEYYRDRANELANKMNRDDKGDLVYSDFDTLAEQAADGFKVLVYDRSYSVMGGSNLPVKKLGWAGMYTAAGVNGITVGLTGEAAVNPNIPDVSLPFNMCREMAHRKAIAAEGDSSFAAFLACQANESLEFQYSAYYMAYRYCHQALTNVKGSEGQAAADEVSMGENEKLRHDMDAYRRFFKRNMDEKASRLANTVNDTYLKISGDKDGVDSTNSVSDLLVSWHYQEVVLPTLTEEDEIFDPKDETQVDLTTTQVPPEGQDEAEEETEGE